MRQIDTTGLMLCDLQARAFELTLSEQTCSSEIFIRRFMNSEAAKLLDSVYSAGIVMTPEDILDRVEEQYGPTSYGSVRYTANELFWIGYIYRYFSFTYDLSSAQAYRMVKPGDLKEMYPACHTMDPAQAIERILEAKKIVLYTDLQTQYELFRRIVKEEAGKIR